MKYDTNSFSERFNRWRNGENYWNIVGSPLPTYESGKDGPSKRLYEYLEDAEGTDWKEQVIKHGDPVKVHYDETRKQLGDDVWNKLNQNQKDALTSYRYNIKYNSFKPTIQALKKWSKSGNYSDLIDAKNTINVGYNRKNYGGLPKRRNLEQDWFMEQSINATNSAEYIKDMQKFAAPVSTRIQRPIIYKMK